MIFSKIKEKMSLYFAAEFVLTLFNPVLPQADELRFNFLTIQLLDK